MKKRVQAFVYLDSDNYISLESLDYLYIAASLISIIILANSIIGQARILTIAILAWHVFYLALLCVLHNKHTKKTFPLRFLVNGITGFFISSLFAMLLVSISIVSNIVGVDFIVWLFFIYIFFLVLYTILIVMGIHKGIYQRIKEKRKNKVFLMVTNLTIAVLPCVSVIGIYISKIIRTTASKDIQNVVGMFFLILVIFLSGLSHVNFVQYYYCKKYEIACDGDGNAFSPFLECQIQKKHRTKRKRSPLPLFLKVLLIITCVPATIFLTLLIIGIIVNL